LSQNYGWQKDLYPQRIKVLRLDNIKVTNLYFELHTTKIPFQDNDS